MTLKKNLSIYLIGKTTSELGSQIQTIAIPLFVLQLTGSGMAMGLIFFWGMIAGLGTLPFASVISDRWNRKKAMAILDIVHGGLILIWAFLSLFNQLNMGYLLLITILRGVLSGFFQSSANAFLMDIVDKEALRSANSLSQTFSAIARIAGPALGGILFGTVGITLIFFINAFSFIISGISEFFIDYHYEKRTDRLNLKKFFVEFGEGFSIVKNIKGLLPMFVFVAILNMIDTPIIPILVPYLGREVLGINPTQIGLLTTVYTIGTMLSGILIATLLKKVKSKTLVATGVILAPGFQIILAFMIFPQVIAFFTSLMALYVLVLIIFFMMGTTDSMVNVPLLTSLQILIPPNARARVMTIFGIMASLFVPFGGMIYGILLDKVPTHIILLTVSVATMIISFVFLYFIPWKRIENGES
jgi:MFS family permease